MKAFLDLTRCILFDRNSLPKVDFLLFLCSLSMWKYLFICVSCQSVTPYLNLKFFGLLTATEVYCGDLIHMFVIYTFSINVFIRMCFCIMFFLNNIKMSNQILWCLQVFFLSLQRHIRGKVHTKNATNDVTVTL